MWYDDGELDNVNGDLCDRCKGEAQSSHTCPFDCDMNGDYESTCNCCVECENKCVMDI